MLVGYSRVADIKPSGRGYSCPEGVFPGAGVTTDVSLPVVDPPPDASARTRNVEAGSDATVAGILLAAGRSERFGPGNKLLADIEGEPVVRRAARSLLSSWVDDVAVVLGHDGTRVGDALAGLDLRAVRNEAYDAGQSTSVRRGIEAVRDHAEAAVIALGDMPFVDPGTIDALVAAYDAGAGTALAAAHEGERGNPVLFDAVHFDDLAAIEGDAGGRSILLAEGRLVETGDPGVRRDVDAPEDIDTG